MSLSPPSLSLSLSPCQGTCQGHISTATRYQIDRRDGKEGDLSRTFWRNSDFLTRTEDENVPKSISFFPFLAFVECFCLDLQTLLVTLMPFGLTNVDWTWTQHTFLFFSSSSSSIFLHPLYHPISSFLLSFLHSGPKT